MARDDAKDLQEMDEMQPWKAAWAAHGAALERSLAIDERLLREVLLGKVRRALLPYVLWRAIEVALGVGALALVVPVLAAHVGERRYVVAAGALAVYAAGMTALCAYLLVAGLQLDYGRPVTAIRRDVERLRIAEYRALKWAVLGGVLAWLPAALVLFEVVTGVDALARVDLAWLVANLLLGVAMLALGLALSKRYVERADAKPWARRLRDAVSGRALRSATAHLAELASFEREEPTAG
jgi:hypothetical protein